MIWRLTKGLVFILSVLVYLVAFYVATFVQSVFVPLDWP